MGLAGGIVGFLVGVVLAGVLTGPVDGDGGIGQLVLNFGLLWPALFVSIVITTVASWIPATLAGRQDPAVILRNE